MRRPKLTVAQIADLEPVELREEWQRHYARTAPNLSPDLLRCGLAWRLQERRQGGFSREALRLIRHAASANDTLTSHRPPPRKLTPGTRLVRDWHGVGHSVTVLDQGFEYDGQHWQSLSAIARAITGAHWSGPRFFGLTRS